jgi:hypothetical protein
MEGLVDVCSQPAPMESVPEKLSETKTPLLQEAGFNSRNEGKGD